MARQTRYSAERVAEVLAIADTHSTLAETARETGIHYNTLKYWREQALIDSEIRNVKKDELADVYQQAVQRWLGLSTLKEKTADFRDLVRAAAIATDKMLLLRGEATSITGKVDTEGKREKLLELLAGTKSPTIDVEPEPPEAERELEPGASEN